MGYQINVSTYELKANLSRYIRALHRGDCDAVIVRRYGRRIAAMIPLTDKPALPPQTKADIAMRSRAVYVETGIKSRRSPS